MKTTLVLLTLSVHCLSVAADWGVWTSWSECKCDQKETRSRAALPLKDMITCITFNQPDPYGIKRGQWVKVFKVVIETDHNIWNVSGNCGYFDSTKKAHLEIPYIFGNQFSQFSFSFWYRRHPGHDDEPMGLVNNGNCKLSPSFSLISPSAGNTCGKLFNDEGIFEKDTNQERTTLITQCPMTIGSYLCADFFHGHMDSISFFKSGLSQTDISLYDNGGCDF
ncbi:hypothetical protein NP493_879g01038 [Ridgeia piscesae]|uniref:Uncharacterized protein n=1 Tax=Ridgeia piscesae TaxID=27915 RepID=A0AAD9NK87_RIDPI|nr:hypothetical protein NP493_879g01038 [Ridgeia piscesae]